LASAHLDEKKTVPKILGDIGRIPQPEIFNVVHIMANVVEKERLLIVEGVQK
jgi:hypothetical protein